MEINRKTLSGTTLAALAVLLVAFVVLSNLLITGARLDLTQGSLYTLTPGSRAALGKLEEPVNLYLFFSEQGTREIPVLRTYAQRVRELLEEMVRHSGGKLRLQVIDPVPFSEEEDDAVRFGLQGVPAGAYNENIFFGLAATNMIDGREVIPFMQPDRERFLEYEVVRLIHKLAMPERPVVGVISSLPVGPGLDPATRQMREGWMIISDLEQLFDVRILSPTSNRLDDDLQVLMLIHPKELSEDLVYAVDQFVLGGGRLIVFVDPHSDADTDAVDPNNPSSAMFANRSSDLPALFRGWGVEYDPDQVVLDSRSALQIQMGQGAPPVRHLALLGFQPQFLNQDDVISAELASVNVATAGHFRLREGSSASLVPLVQTSGEAMVVPSERVKFLSDPASLFQGFVATDERYVIAARLEGVLPSAFPARMQSNPDHLLESAAPVSVVLFADSDLLGNRMWVQVQNFFGEQVVNAFAGNGDLVVNAVDNLIGSGDLISIRGRASSQRPFTRVDDLNREADDRFRATEQQLRQQLADTQQRLAELQAGKSDDQRMILSQAERAEIERFQSEQVRIRRQLRAVQRDLNADKEALGTRVKLVNILLMPILLTGAALLYAARRRRLRTSSQNGA